MFPFLIFDVKAKLGYNIPNRYQRLGVTLKLHHLKDYFIKSKGE